MLRQALREVAAQSSDLLAYGYHYDLPVGEETLTDVDLIAARRVTNGAFSAKKFTKAEESVVGADWHLDWDLWRLPSWRLRVQAKKQYHEPDPFPRLNSREGVEQLDRLIESAERDAADAYYCLYLCDFFPLGDANEPPMSSCCRHRELTGDDFGCTLVSAYAIRQVVRTRRFAMSDLEGACWPWSCLGCPDGFSEKGSLWSGLGPQRPFNPRPFGRSIPESVLAYARDPFIPFDRTSDTGYTVVISSQG